MHQPKEMAWNGVGFRIPADWEISRMGQRYLQLEDDRGPVFELRWQAVKGRFSHAVHLKRMNSLSWMGKRARVEACDMPAEWTTALERYSTQAFHWTGTHLKGRGAILYCAHCRTAHLMQFLRSDIIDNRRLCRDILASLYDHPLPEHNGHLRWAVYDLRADIPPSYRLRNYRFEAGAFALEFDGDQRSTLSLRRWGPASVLLDQQSLEAFVTAQVPWADASGGGARIREGNFIHVERYEPLPAWTYWVRRLQSKPSYHWLHAWHDQHHNRILAVDARGAAPLHRDMLQEVSDRYVMV